MLNESELNKLLERCEKAMRRSVTIATDRYQKLDPAVIAELVREVLATRSQIGMLRDQLKETQAAAEKWYRERY